ncbi:hypothetical protein Ctha_0168 [Chloroherpeton thalassium ATCC 35110]|uniref:Tfp pilus assembly protein ATPase PilM-like protein n=1 Tax=Chloroherpeton thalassium (strain ATCC 35110 / GB-78) TaxID=517418 RepID=B3QSZ6_CHLT3|nr:hypothetical protein [Chloroherpeton thalassium]ACF12639.1 hypothetical protein Ctha_0168 [Chloroherpeton thalassium ATCC 35110]
MSKSQLSLSIEKQEITLVHLTQEDSGQYIVQDCHEMHFGFDIYEDVFEHGHSKAMLAVMHELIPALEKYIPQKLSVCVNMDKIKCVRTFFDRDLSETEFADECEDEAEKFLCNPEAYTLQAVRLWEQSDMPYERYLLVFMPKQVLNRLQMLIAPARKNINLIDGSHMSLQNLYRDSQEAMLLIEIESRYFALSLMNKFRIEEFSYWNLASETDAAYFALTEMQKLEIPSKIYAIGSGASPDAMAFLSGVIGVRVMPLTMPAQMTFNCEKKDATKYLKALGCAIKAVNEF